MKCLPQFPFPPQLPQLFFTEVAGFPLEAGALLLLMGVICISDYIILAKPELAKYHPRQLPA
jgi:hypothetical protein